MRALIAARKSNQVDGGEGQSLDTQDQHSRAFCERLGWEIAGAARDTISGRVAPIDRKGLGAWLAEPHRFHVIVAYKSDRLSRGTDMDWSRIETWAADNGKTLCLVDGSTGIRYPARNDSDFWQWTAAKRQAGAEWEAIRERIVRAHKALEASGSFIGRPPFGYKVEGPKYGKRLVVDEDRRALVIMAFEMAAASKSLTEIAIRLDDATDLRWHETKVWRLIQNWAYAGRLERGGQHYADCPPIVTASLLETARKTVATRARKDTGGRPSANPPLMVMRCGGCETGRLYLSSNHYRCRGIASDARPGCGLRVPKGVDAKVIAILTSSTEPEMRSLVVKGRNWADQIETLRRDRRQALDRDDIDAVVALTARLKEVEGRETEPDRVELQPTGRTVGEVFAAMDRTALRAALRAWTVIAYPDGRLVVKSPWRDLGS